MAKNITLRRQVKEKKAEPSPALPVLLDYSMKA